MSLKTSSRGFLLAGLVLQAALSAPAPAADPAPTPATDPAATPAAQAAAQVQREPDATAAQNAARRAMADAARETLAALQERLDAGEALTPSMIELQCQSSRRLCLAEQAIAGDKVGREKAAAEHLGRTKTYHLVLVQRWKAGLDVSRVQVTQALYFLREAELWVAEAKAA